ncbi:MAG: long-chain fatty acid--CoA ligase [Pseudomonadota bacterium]
MGATSQPPPAAPWLFERLAGYGDAIALVHRDKPVTYRALLEQVNAWEAEFAKRGIGAGSVVLLEGTSSAGAVGLLLALIRRNAITVPLTPQAPVARETISNIAGAGWQVSFTPGADGDEVATITGAPRAVTAPILSRLVELGHPGIVLFSSGSTGAPKGVVHDCTALLGKFERPGKKKTTLSFLLFDHVGGMDTLLNTLSSGGTLVTIQSRDPETVCAAIAAHGVHTLPTSPTFLNMLLLNGAWQRHDLSSLRLVAYGTEPMPASVLARLAEALPQVTLLQTYGLSELGVLRTRSREGTLWVQFTGEGYETQIRDGILWVRARTSMLGYLNAPDRFDADGWFCTEDAVEVDGDYMRILGRTSDLINVGGRKVYPAEVEEVLLDLPNVRDVAVFGRPNPLTGQIVAARFNLIAPEALDEFKRRMRIFCKDRLPSYKVPVHVEFTDEDQFGARMKKKRSGAAPAR